MLYKGFTPCQGIYTLLHTPYPTREGMRVMGYMMEHPSPSGSRQPAAPGAGWVNLSDIYILVITVRSIWPLALASGSGLRAS